MSFFDDLEKNISDKSAQAGAVIREKAEVIRINNAISAQRVREKEVYQKIGRLYYEKIKGQEVDEEKLNKAVEELESIFENINNMNESLDNIKKFVKCPKCGFEVSKEASFCGGCGNKMK